MWGVWNGQTGAFLDVFDTKEAAWDYVATNPADLADSTNYEIDRMTAN